MAASGAVGWVYERLKTAEEVVVPLRELWNDWHIFHAQPPFGEFIQAIFHDDRFEEVYSVSGDERLEGFGYFPGPRVKLRLRNVTPECILRMVQKHNEILEKALVHATELLDEDPDLQVREALKEAVLMLESLRPAFRRWAHLRRKSDSRKIG